MRKGILSLLSIGVLLFSVQAVYAWTGPSGTAPNNNVSAPINVGSTDQIKNAAIGVNGLAVFGNSLLQAASYLNWGATSGTNGYGIRESGGALEFKNSGGSWQTLQAIVSGLLGGGAGSWTLSGNNLYNTNTGNVGIGNTGSAYKLDVSGSANATSLCIAGDCKSAWPASPAGSYLPLAGGTMVSNAVIDGAGRLHIASQEDIYLLARGGDVLVSNAWGGAGNLYVSGYTDTSDVYVRARGLWASQLGRLGGQFWAGGVGGPSGYSYCPSGSIQVGFANNLPYQQGYECGGEGPATCFETRYDAQALCQWINQ